MAANKSYMQICPNAPADYKVAGNITIGGGTGTATFAAAQTHVLMGIGSVVTYNAGGSVGYVASKIDQSTWILVDANGIVMPNLGATAITSMSPAFASLSAAEAGFAALTGNANITAAGANQDVYFACYCEQATFTADTTDVKFDGATCDATHEIFIQTPFNLATECNFNHRNTNNGIWSTTKYRLEGVTAFVLDCDSTAVNYLHFTGLQIRNTRADTSLTHDCVLMRMATNSFAWLESSILRLDSGTGQRTCVEFLSAFVQTVTIRNCIGYVSADVTSHNISSDLIKQRNANAIAIVIGCTLYNGLRCLWAQNGPIFAFNNILLQEELTSNVSNDGYSDFNVYREYDLGETHGTLTAQINTELFSTASGGVETWNWYPIIGSDLISTGIKLRDEDAGDFGHGVNYRLVLETHPIDDYTDSDTWLPTDFLNPRGRWDVGALAYD